MTITINNTTFELKNTIRSYIIYENITNEVFNPHTLTNIIIYFYSVVMASNKSLVLTFEEFTDWLDDNMIELDNFTKWLVNVNQRNGYINGNTDEKTEVEPKKA